MPFESVIGPGGMLTTVGDWLTWNTALAKNTLFPGHADSLTRRMRLTSGREIQYTHGLVVASYRGVREISHSGSTAGYSTFLARYPDRGDLSIAVLCNSAQGAAGTYVHQLADRLISDFPRPPGLDTTRVDSVAFSRYGGVYRNDRTRAPLEVDARAASRFRALPGGWLWLPNGTRWFFDGAPSRLTIAQPNGDTLTYTYVGAKFWSPTAQELKRFEGTYRSDEVGATYQVKVVGDSLTLSTRPGVVVTVRPTLPDAFARGGTAVWFTRDRNGRVAAMHFSESRVWDLVLPRAR
jgi:hypothetical protein